LLKEPKGRMYDLRTHSVRKFFKTQIMSLGCLEPYADYMMGHKTDTYIDIEMKAWSSCGMSMLLLGFRSGLRLELTR
jgi:hypothetical protein